jgi:hypothetical protein
MNATVAGAGDDDGGAVPERARRAVAGAALTWLLATHPFVRLAGQALPRQVTEAAAPPRQAGIIPRRKV